jgi:glutamine amidotransferase
MIRIIDYGVGNIQAFINAFRRNGIQAERASKCEEIQSADKLILPGVGHFDHAMLRLNRSGLRDAIETAVLDRKIPILGVCVGMQMLAEGSEEGYEHGLGWVPGRVRALAGRGAMPSLALPHMGWNEITPCKSETPLLVGINRAAEFYFLHSYYFEAENEQHILATVTYGYQFCAAVQCANILGVQFHPEKSHHAGTTLLRTFAELEL